MTDLADFLLARIAEDRDWAYSFYDGEPGTPIHQARLEMDYEAKLRLVGELVDYMEGDYAPWNERFMRLLALPYADHPDYREEWRL